MYRSRGNYGHGLTGRLDAKDDPARLATTASKNH